MKIYPTDMIRVVQRWVTLNLLVAFGDSGRWPMQMVNVMLRCNNEVINEAQTPKNFSSTCNDSRERNEENVNCFINSVRLFIFNLLFAFLSYWTTCCTATSQIGGVFFFSMFLRGQGLYIFSTPFFLIHGTCSIRVEPNLIGDIRCACIIFIFIFFSLWQL